MLISNPFKESVRKGLNQVLRQAFNQNVSAQVSVLGCLRDLPPRESQLAAAPVVSLDAGSLLEGSTELFLWKAGGTRSGL